MNKKQYAKEFPSIDSDNPWEVYGTNNINDIPEQVGNQKLERCKNDDKKNWLGIFDIFQ